jgi:hypothetical protein
MSYINAVGDVEGSEALGCGPSCGCAPCRRAAPAAGFGDAGLGQCPGGGKLVILGQITRYGTPIVTRIDGGADQWARAVLVDLRDGEGAPICTTRRWPDALTGGGGFFALRAEFAATQVPTRVTLRFSSLKPGESIVKVTLAPIGLPRESASAVLDVLRVPAKERKRFSKTMEYLLKAARPSPEHLLFGAFVTVDLGDRSLRCVADETCFVVGPGRKAS